MDEERDHLYAPEEHMSFFGFLFRYWLCLFAFLLSLVSLILLLGLAYYWWKAIDEQRKRYASGSPRPTKPSTTPPPTTPPPTTKPTTPKPTTTTPKPTTTTTLPTTTTMPPTTTTLPTTTTTSPPEEEIDLEVETTAKKRKLKRKKKFFYT